MRTDATRAPAEKAAANLPGVLQRSLISPHLSHTIDRAFHAQMAQ